MGSQKSTIIIGAGPAGLTAAYELLQRTSIKPIILEQTDYMGGISRTVRYKGNRMDIGGHRFFSKADRVMKWWVNILPPESAASQNGRIAYQNQSRELGESIGEKRADPQNDDRVMLVRPRKSRIYFMRRFFEYPLKLTIDTLSKLGAWKTVRIGFSYMRSMMFPIKPEKSLEDFFINRFGRELYRTFFKSYTEKVWGVPCEQISAEWGAQRIKGLSIVTAILHMVKSLAPKKGDIAQKDTETSLIEQFLYPKYGPGQMWEEVARQVQAGGAEIHTEIKVIGIVHNGSRITAVRAREERTGKELEFAGDYFFSTMPVKDLIEAWTPPAPEAVRQVSSGLIYRDFITVGLLCKKLVVQDSAGPGQMIRDNWIYIQEPDVLIGRLQIFNNWSPYMVADPSTVWLGLEYFCYETDELWKKSDEEMIALAKRELQTIGITHAADILDATVIRMPKTYPAYFGEYGRFGVIREYVDRFENLFLVGRNGMHKYNNQDHSMLTAMVAVDNIAADIKSKDNLWAVNTEMEYHEEKGSSAAAR
jgi:protoporphyrinogen oxidase